MNNLTTYPLALLFALIFSLSANAQSCVSCSNTFAIMDNMITNSSAFMHGRVAMGNISTSAQLTVHNNSSAQYAGYFMGNLHYTGSLSGPSDLKLKKDIRPIDNALSLVLRLNGKNYAYRNEEYSGMNLSDGLQYGFIAQDVEKVLPDLVDVVDQELSSIDGEGNKKAAGELSYKGVNYIGFIPVLTEAIKEQQSIIDKQNAAIEALEARILALEVPASQGKRVNTITETRAVLMQNAPNPFNKETTIRYELPTKAQNALMIIHDLQGRQVDEYLVDNSGTLTIKAGELEAGMYLYSLVVEGKVVSTLKMMLTK